MNIKIAMKNLKDSIGIINLEATLIYVYLKQNKIDYKNSDFYYWYLESISEENVFVIEEWLSNNKITLELDTLVELFELIVPEKEKKENGVVYTPSKIKDYILSQTIVGKRTPKVCDPACGCGSFLASAALFLHDKYKLSFKEIFSNYIYGVDISKHNIEKTKMLFSLLALRNNEKTNLQFNLIQGNSLNLLWDDIFEEIISGFDVVLGNPPYVRTKNISQEVKDSLKYWRTASVGLPDLYIPFYELGLSILNSNGKLGFISVNTFLKSLNGRELRKLLLENKYEMSIIDFKEEQMFKRITSYTCISIINKEAQNDKLYYAPYYGEKDLRNTKFYSNRYSELNDYKKGWNFGDQNELMNIKKIEAQKNRLGDFLIKNGIATLKNDLFIFTPYDEDDKYYYRTYYNENFKIEKSVCVNMAKPNIMKNEEELERYLEKAIFPYKLDDNNSVVVIKQEEMEENYPNCLHFLKAHKNILDNRDKGKGNYPTWYSYGRTQGLNNPKEKKLLIPYMANQPIAIISESTDLIFYCGYGLFCSDEITLYVLKKIMESSLFWYYIKKTSKPYNNGYFSTAKNYLINFSYPELSDTEKQTLINLEKTEVDKYLCELYNIAYEDII
ncbi:class I SAM-dependent DNA methyltransferase [Salibacterium lacus]|uniref:site-specific DNA-methyltransferase (adenine-specific) n=1 Tax=Salibacterium lacus TaxID=1898109 RepID=A0ABW5T447_9BACI